MTDATYFSNLDELRRAFVSGNFRPGQKVITIENSSYRCTENSTQHSMLSMINEDARGVVVYENDDDGWLIFLWGEHRNAVVPYDVRTTTRPVFEAESTDDRVIADKVEVQFINLPVANSLVAKVDTGAEMCSLHAEDVDMSRGHGTVSFVSPELSRNKFTLDMADRQAVKTSGGKTTYRPVVKMDIKVKGKVLKDVLVNLNDRSTMDEPMLLGQNALQAGKFIVDPNIMKEANKLLTPEFLAALQRDEVIPPHTISDETAAKLYEALNEVGDVSISNLLKLLRTQVLESVDTITY